MIYFLFSTNVILYCRSRWLHEDPVLVRYERTDETRYLKVYAGESSGLLEQFHVQPPPLQPPPPSPSDVHAKSSITCCRRQGSPPPHPPTSPMNCPTSPLSSFFPPRLLSCSYSHQGPTLWLSGALITPCQSTLQFISTGMREWLICAVKPTRRRIFL